MPKPSFVTPCRLMKMTTFNNLRSEAEQVSASQNPDGLNQFQQLLSNAWVLIESAQKLAKSSPTYAEIENLSVALADACTALQEALEVVNEPDLYR